MGPVDRYLRTHTYLPIMYYIMILSVPPPPGGAARHAQISHRHAQGQQPGTRLCSLDASGRRRRWKKRSLWLGGRDHASAGGRRGRARGQRRSRRYVIYASDRLYSTVSVQARRWAYCVFWEEIEGTEARSRRDEMYALFRGTRDSGGLRGG